jgi:signal transduction histidine kinase
MNAVFVVIVAISLALQVVAACLAVRLIRVTGTSMAWLAIAGSVAAMAIRRTILLCYTPETITSGEIWSEIVGLLVAVLILTGIATIGPIFRTVQKAREAIEQSHDKLEKEVARQTSELVAANEQLRQEITRRAEVEAALHEEHRHLSSVLSIYEADRQLIAYDMHDGFVQTATAAQMGLQSALAAYARDPDRALEHVVGALQNLQQSLSQVRRLIRGLRPVVLEESGLIAAIEQLVHDTETNSDVHIDWSSQVAFDRLSPALETSIFRIIQEALTNAIRHGKSERVAIEMTQTERTIHLRIEDWGSGFDLAAPQTGHYGLEGIRERARLFDGTARIESAPGKGARIEVELPLIEREG